MGRIEELLHGQSFIINPVEAAKQKAAASAKEAGKNFADGIIDQVCSTFAHWFTEVLDLLAYKSVMFGILLYIMGIKKGGHFSWVTFSVWVCLRVVLSFGGVA